MKTYKALQSENKAATETVIRYKDDFAKLHNTALKTENSLYRYKLAIVILLVYCVILTPILIVSLGATQ